VVDLKEIRIGAVISVKDLGNKLELPVTKLIALLLKNGIMATINESLDFETAAIIAEEFGVSAVLDERKADVHSEEVAPADLEARPPVVTIMGHVDHGKTTLVDTIRESNVAAGESGGITQHITAYQVTLKSTKKHKIDRITFLDTPGHAAFTALRQHGANITDVVVLVVAANDGVKAQTIEAIDHAKQAHVPIIVAVTKMDLPDANPDRIKQQLAELELVPEDWGGQTVIIPVSAKTKLGLNDLLEMVLLVADLQDLKARPSGKAVGVIVESHLEPGKGPVATVLIQNGQLMVGEPVAIGPTYGKIRSITDFHGARVEQAGPSDPVTISGLRAVPTFGEQLIACANDKEAKEQAAAYSREHVISKVHSMAPSGLESAISTEILELHELPLVIRTDAKGSLEAIHKVLEDINTAEASVKITHEGVGAVSESDITHAKATHGSVLAFRVPVASNIRNLASKEKVGVYSYDVIYDLVEDVKKALSKLLPPEHVEVAVGTAKVIALFKGDKRKQVVGVQVEEGMMMKDAMFHLMRKKESVGDGSILQIRRGKDEVKQVESGQQAGLSIPGTLEVAEGDIVQAYRTETRYRTL